MAKQKSDLKRAFSEDGALKTHVGGQALIEGIMMRGKYNWGVAVREPGGGIYTEEHDLASGKEKNRWLRLPLVRGCTAFVESLALGYKALEVAMMHAFNEDPEGEGSNPESPSQGRHDPQRAATSAEQSEGAPGNPPTTTGRHDPQRAATSAEQSDGAPGRPFSWKDDFGNPDEMIDALGAQRTLQVVSEPTSWEEGPEEPGGTIAHANTSSAPQERVDSAQRAESHSRLISASEAHEEERPVGVPTNSESGVPQGSSGPASQVDQSQVDQPQVAKQQEEEGFEFGHREMVVSMVLGLALGVFLFIVAPAFLTNLIVGEYDDATLLWNIVDGLLRVAVFVFYIWLIGRMSDIKRMFGYHGAEHKTIHCYEHGLDLTPENARSFPRLHVRCGTAFLIMVMIIAIFVYTITPLGALIEAWGVPDGAPKLALVILVRILLMPLIAGVSYEITVKWAGSHPDNPLVKVILWPGMQMQYLTTREPDDGQIECAIEAMRLVLVREQAEEAAHAASV